MIKGKNILCFGSENWEYPGFQQTIMRKLSTSNRVIFVNPLGSRKVKLDYSQLSIYLRKIKRTFAKKYTPSTNCLVCSPRIIPLVYNSMITQLNKQLIKYQFSKLLTKNNFKTYILWIGTPTAAIFLDLFDPEMTVYHAVDRYSEFSFVDREKINLYEKIVAEKADVILCTSDAIRDDLVKYNKFAYTVTHAVDTDLFNPTRILDIPDELKDINRPLIGFIGGLVDWVDYDLLYNLAKKMPNICLVLIGRKDDSVDFSSLQRLPNVLWLGYKDFNILPNYLNMFSVCLIPYVINDRVEAVDPIKLREYLAMGKPVVSTELPEVKKLNNFVYIGKNADDFVAKVKVAIEENNSNLTLERMAIAQRSNWESKLDDISQIVKGAI
jgi:glycosyltransferase involved in cell wall biosynthesis